MKDARMFLRNQSERKQVEWFVPSLSTHHTKVGLKYDTNKHVYVLRKRFLQILKLHNYWKVELSNWSRNKQGTGGSSDDSSDNGSDSEILKDKGNPIGKKMIHASLFHSAAKKIMKRLHLLESKVEEKLETYEEKYKKSSDKELKKKGKVNLRDQKFHTGDKVNLYWIVYDVDGVDEISRECITDGVGFETVHFENHVQYRNKRDRYVIRMRKNDFDDVVIEPKKMNSLERTDIENEDSTDNEYISISVWNEDPN